MISPRHLEAAPVADLVQMAVAPDGDIELHVVVGPVACAAAQHAALAAAVAPAEYHGLELSAAE
jgi:hypothetical protein